MADLFLTWEEAQGERLPHYCVSCAAPATDWADWRICKTQHRVFSHDYTYVDVTLPVCPEHRNLHWIPLYRVNAKEIFDDGVVLGHVSPGFVEAVWDYREQRERQSFQTEPPSLRSSSSRRQADFQEHGILPRTRYVQGRSEGGSFAWTAQKFILIVLALLFLAPCGALLAFGLLGLLLKLAFG